MKLLTTLLSMALLFLSACGGSSTTEETKLLAPSGDQIYFGAFPDFGGSEDNVTTQKVKDFETIAGKKIAWAYFSQNWYNGITYPKSAVHAIDKSGAVPFVRLMPRSDEIQGHAERWFSMQHIIEGKFDPQLRQWAKDAKEDGIPLLMDFAVEANGDWFQWSGKFTGGSKTDRYGDPSYPDGPERYRDAYRHIIEIFRQEKVSTVTWFYHFNYASFPDKSWNQPHYYYPGDAYIDWVGFSLYGAQTLDEEWKGLAFSTQLKQYHKSIQTLHTDKPIALLEFGVTDHHPDGNKSAWLEDAFDTILHNDIVTFAAISPWHETWENEDGSYSAIRLDSSLQTQQTFRKRVANKRFVPSLRFRQNNPKR